MTDRGWTWFGSKKSVSSGKLSIFAVIEVLVATSVFWIVALYFQTYTHLLAGLFLAPLSMLRSDESVRSVHGYYARAEDRAYRFQLYGFLIASWLIATNAPIWIWIVALLNSVAIGHVFNAWYVQFGRSLVYLNKGLRNLPENFYRNMFTMDLFVEPELIPASKNFEAIPHWKFSLFQKVPRNPIHIVAALNITNALILIVLSRLFVKSTIWFYLPLLYLVGRPKVLDSPEDLIIWLKSQTAKVHEWLRFILAVSTILVAVVAAIEPEALSSLLDASRVGETPISMFSLVFVLDFESLYPWQYLTLPSAALTVVIFFWLDSLRREAQVGRGSFGSQPQLLLRIVRVRNLLVVAWLVVAFCYALHFFHMSCSVPDWLAIGLSVPFGTATCPPPGLALGLS